jgi:hypothetical protein
MQVRYQAALRPDKLAIIAERHCFSLWVPQTPFNQPTPAVKSFNARRRSGNPVGKTMRATRIDRTSGTVGVSAKAARKR